MHVKNKAVCEPFHSAHGEVVYELSGLAVGGGVQHSVAHIDIAPGKASLKHYHPVAEESYYILSGEAKIVIDEEVAYLKPGDTVVINKGSWHQIFNHSQSSLLSFLAICTPPWDPECSVFAA